MWFMVMSLIHTTTKERLRLMQMLMDTMDMDITDIMVMVMDTDIMVIDTIDIMVIDIMDMGIMVIMDIHIMDISMENNHNHCFEKLRATQLYFQ